MKHNEGAQEKATAFVREQMGNQGFTVAEYIGQWHHYNVYVAGREDNKLQYVSLPHYVLVGNNIVRWVQPNEYYDVRDTVYHYEDYDLDDL